MGRACGGSLKGAAYAAWLSECHGLHVTDASELDGQSVTGGMVKCRDAIARRGWLPPPNVRRDGLFDGLKKGGGPQSAGENRRRIWEGGEENRRTVRFQLANSWRGWTRGAIPRWAALRTGMGHALSAWQIVYSTLVYAIPTLRALPARSCALWHVQVQDAVGCSEARPAGAILLIMWLARRRRTVCPPITGLSGPPRARCGEI